MQRFETGGSLFKTGIHHLNIRIHHSRGATSLGSKFFDSGFTIVSLGFSTSQRFGKTWDPGSFGRSNFGNRWRLKKVLPEEQICLEKCLFLSRRGGDHYRANLGHKIREIRVCPFASFLAGVEA